MLKIITIIIVYLIGLVSFAQNSQEVNSLNEIKESLKVTALVKNVVSDQGTIQFAIYDSEESFKQRKPLEAKGVSINNGVAKVSFEGLNPKTYAIICYHDANGNGKMDFQENGMPLEDYGATNNVFNYGPPQFNNAKFELIDKDLTFEIKFM
ncbi:MAG: DUF2141 domain-containing protein [Bacteroidota bacterium]